MINQVSENNTKFILFQREVIFPKWLVVNPIAFFLIAMILCWIAYGYIPNLDLAFVAILSVCAFFYSSRNVSIKLSYVGEKEFLQSIFKTGFIIRILWVLYMFLIFNPQYYGNTFGSIEDVEWYMKFGQELSRWLSGNTDNTFLGIVDAYMAAVDDIAYPVILAIEYFLTAGISSVFIPMVIKCVMSAYIAIIGYRITKRHFGEGTARIAAILLCLNPNMIYWCANMMKETEMVFICCLAIDKLDISLSSNKKLLLRDLLPGLLIGLILFFMRTPLAIALFMAILMHILLASKKIISTGKKIVIGIIVLSTLYASVGNRLIYQSKDYIQQVESDAQGENMEWRSQRAGGNQFAKYGSAVVFAPLIFTIPFPTFNVANEAQLIQIQLAGGSYIKNIFSFFVIITLILLIMSGQWRRHVFIITYLCAYLVVLAFSGFAQSGRFHMPVWPMLMIFAAYGIQMAKADKRIRNWFTYVLFAEVFVCLVWNWFKLAGRGMI